MDRRAERLRLGESLVNNPEIREKTERAGAPSETYSARLHELERREWWTWARTVLVMMTLTGGIASLAYPAIQQDGRAMYRSGVFQAVAGLVLLIALFGCYLTFEMVLIHRLRMELAERQFHSTQWRNLALVDSLTGLYNRRYAERRLKEEIARSQRKGYDLVVVLLDLNNFKQINDRFGHAAGDAVLTEFGIRLSHAIREGDFAARLGGDEFLLLLTECKRSQVQSVLTRLESMEVNFEGQRIGIDFSAGWRQYAPGDLPQHMLDEADKALYLNKQAGKGLPT
jgi:diguanylate cyclase (GGDEF)-like protein